VKSLEIPPCTIPLFPLVVLVVEIPRIDGEHVCGRTGGADSEFPDFLPELKRQEEK